jgi:ankyrin repeat protein
MVQYLLSQGADINAITGKKWQPIHHAMRFDHAVVANYLIVQKASLQTKTSDGLTALELAKGSQKSAIQSIIRQHTL